MLHRRSEHPKYEPLQGFRVCGQGPKSQTLRHGEYRNPRHQENLKQKARNPKPTKPLNPKPRAELEVAKNRSCFPECEDEAEVEEREFWAFGS